ncbi:MAG: hypothetical protein K8S25_13985 [Alphaproteobacteria bacterium]|nr:hypothetical protein [Alphaproteobacteria bacterium]
MTRISDETLMAYSDGELDQEQAESVRVALDRDAALRRRLQSMQEIDEDLRAAFAPDLEMPDRFAKLLRPESAASVTHLVPKRANWIGRNWLPSGAAIAAGFIGLVAGGVLTSGSTAWLRRVDDGIAVASAVQSVVEHTPSGKLVQADGLNVTPIVSFVAKDGRVCRELHLNDGKLAARIVACKDADEDEWCIEAFVRVPPQGSAASYHTAGAPKDPVIDAAFARLGVSGTLDAKAEGDAIANGWSKK